MFGNPETTTGGRALKFYASIRLDMRRIQSIKEGDRVVGSRTRGKVVKNKVAAPFREAEFDIIYGEGISLEGDLLDMGVEQNIVEKSGTWLSFGGERLGQGRDNARVFLKEHKDIRAKTRIRAAEEAGDSGHGPECDAAGTGSEWSRKHRAREATDESGGSGGHGQQSEAHALTRSSFFEGKQRAGRGRVTPPVSF